MKNKKINKKSNGSPVDTGGQNPPKVDALGKASFLSQLSPHLQLEMKSLLKEEVKILTLLSDKEKAAQFICNPEAFFKTAKIELTPILKRKVRSFSFQNQISDQSFILPNGQVLQPKININIKKQ